jgi:hypothetical protein
MGYPKNQVWIYAANLAYGVTTTRDPQTATTDVLTYSDMVEAGKMVDPRVYSTFLGLVFGPIISKTQQVLAMPLNNTASILTQNTSKCI